MIKCSYCGSEFNQTKTEFVNKKEGKITIRDKVTSIRCANCRNLLYGKVEHVSNKKK